MLIVMLVFSPLPGFKSWTFNPLAQPSELPILPYYYFDLFLI